MRKNSQEKQFTYFEYSFCFAKIHHTYVYAIKELLRHERKAQIRKFTNGKNWFKLCTHTNRRLMENPSLGLRKKETTEREPEKLFFDKKFNVFTNNLLVMRSY